MTEPELRTTSGGADDSGQSRRLGPADPPQGNRAYRSSAARAAARWRREHGLKEPVPLPSAIDEMVVGLDVDERGRAPSMSRFDRIVARLRRFERPH